MSLSKNINTYRDIEQILLAAKRAGGARYKLRDYREAVRWRVRAYTFRKLLMEQLSEVSLPGHTPETPYDTMRLSIDGDTVLIQFDLGASGQLETFDGRPITPTSTPAAPEVVDELDLEDFDIASIAARLVEEE